jgi:hypothetical protein
MSELGEEMRMMRNVLGTINQFDPEFTKPYIEEFNQYSAQFQPPANR